MAGGVHPFVVVLTLLGCCVLVLGLLPAIGALVSFALVMAVAAGIGSGLWSLAMALVHPKQRKNQQTSLGAAPTSSAAMSGEGTK